MFEERVREKTDELTLIYDLVLIKSFKISYFIILFSRSFLNMNKCTNPSGRLLVD